MSHLHADGTRLLNEQIVTDGADGVAGSSFALAAAEAERQRIHSVRQALGAP